MQKDAFVLDRTSQCQQYGRHQEAKLWQKDHLSIAVFAGTTVSFPCLQVKRVMNEPFDIACEDGEYTGHHCVGTCRLSAVIT